MVMSRKFTDVVFISQVNLMVLWNEFSFSRKVCSCFSLAVQIVNISSMYLFHSSGLIGCSLRIFCSRSCIKMLA